MRLQLGLVSETTESFINQVKLCLFSLRRNAGALKEVPVTLITNSEPLGKEERGFLEKHFSPIEFKTSPRLGATPHASKLGVFYAIDPSTYDVLIFMDCDTVVRGPLDHMIDAIRDEGAQFLCRRGGETDRNRFVDFDALVARYCGRECRNRIPFEAGEEWPMFNSGVFVATPDAVLRIRKDAIEFTYRLFNEWQRTDAVERRLIYAKIATRYLYRYEILRPLFRWKILSRQEVVDWWALEQGALALSCIKAGIRVGYLDETYNAWGGSDDFTVLHCFKSLYAFDRAGMLSEAAESWIEEYLDSDIPGKRFLAETARQYRRFVA